MSDCPDDKDKQDGSSEDQDLPEDCFWVQHGRCFLYRIEEGTVFEFLARIPKARKDLLTCGRDNKCPFTDDDFIACAEKGVTVKDARQKSDRFQKLMNKFTDRHRKIRGGRVYRKPDDTSDDDE